VNVLIVDDEPVVLRIVEKVLQRAGYEVHATTSAAGALEAAQQIACIDLLVSDASLPEMDGRILGKTLKERLYPKLRVVLMSGWDRETLSNKRIIQFDSDIFLPKPFDSAALLAAVEQALDGIKGPRAAGGA
jgi:CheY-like chemotaxis protein